MAELLTHPPAKELSEFGLGLLDEDSVRRVASHLEECDECQRAVADSTGDTFTELLVGAKTVLDNPVPGEIIPPELAAHPRYTPLKLLGVGGMGTVWLAEHAVMGRRVAVKIIRPEFLARPGAGQRFRREVAAAARLHHPNIVTAFDAEQAGDVHFLAMEYIDGVGLDELLKEKGALPVADACRHALDAANGLEHAHRAGLVHRDVKPGNLMRATDGSVKVLDFGLAMLVADDRADMSLTGANMVVGTPDYIAPEQAEHPQAADGRADIYALGCSLYHMLTGTPPFPGASVLKKLDAHRQDRPKALTGFRQDIPRGLAEVVAKMMAKDPADRFPSAAAVATALRPYIDSATTPPRTRSRLPALVAAGLFLTVLLAGAVIYRIQTDKGELVISAQSEDVEIAIRQGGKLVTIIDTKTQKKVELQSGEYDLELPNPDGLKLDITRATLMRGEKVLASIVRLPKNMAKGDYPIPMGGDGMLPGPVASVQPGGVHIERTYEKLPAGALEPPTNLIPAPSLGTPPVIRDAIPPAGIPVSPAEALPMTGTGSLPAPVAPSFPTIGIAPPSMVPTPSGMVPIPNPTLPGLDLPSPIKPGPTGIAPPVAVPSPGGLMPIPGSTAPGLDLHPPINPGPTGIASPGALPSPRGVVPTPSPNPGADPLIPMPNIPGMNVAPPINTNPPSHVGIAPPFPGAPPAENSIPRNVAPLPGGPTTLPPDKKTSAMPPPMMGSMGLGAGPKREQAIHWPPKPLPAANGFMSRLPIGIAEYDALKFSPDERLVGVGNGQSITVLETATGKELARLQRNDLIWAFTPDSKGIVIANRAGPNIYGFEHWLLETGEVSRLGTPIRLTERINSITTQGGPDKLVLETDKSVCVFETKVQSIVRRVSLLPELNNHFSHLTQIGQDGRRNYSMIFEQVQGKGIPKAMGSFAAPTVMKPDYLKIDFLAEDREPVKFKTPGNFWRYFEVASKPGEPAREPLIGILYEAENADAFVDYYDLKGKSRGHVPCGFKVAALRANAPNTNRAVIASAKDPSSFEAIDLANGFKRTPIARIANQDGLSISAGGRVFAARTESGWNLHRLPDPPLNEIAAPVSIQKSIDDFILKSGKNKIEQGPTPREKTDIHKVILTGTGLITVDGKTIKIEQLKNLPLGCEVNLLAEKESSAELLRTIIMELVEIKAKVNVAESRDPEKGITR